MIAYGILNYNDDGEYIVGEVNLSSIFDDIYFSPISNYIKIKVTSGTKTMFNEEGNLMLRKIDSGIYCIHVDSDDLESVLFNNVGKEIEVILGRNRDEFMQDLQLCATTY